MLEDERMIPVGQRADAIAARFREGRREPKPPPKKPVSDAANLKRARAVLHRQRRARLASEYLEWLNAIVTFGGDVSKIARHMGCDITTANRAIWDLGLWPELVKARTR